MDQAAQTTRAHRGDLAYCWQRRPVARLAYQHESVIAVSGLLLVTVERFGA